MKVPRCIDMANLVDGVPANLIILIVCPGLFFFQSQAFNLFAAAAPRDRVDRISAFVCQGSNRRPAAAIVSREKSGIAIGRIISNCQDSAAYGGNRADDDYPKNCPMPLSTPVRKFGRTGFVSLRWSTQVINFWVRGSVEVQF